MPLLLLGGCAAGAFVGAKHFALLGSASAEAAEIRLLKIAPRAGAEVPPVLTATGKIVSDHRVQVTTKVSGQIVSLFFEQGHRVKKGQVLARLEDVTYRARRNEAAARLEKARAGLKYHEFNFERTSELFEQKTAPQIEFADAQRGLSEARAQVAAEQAALESAQKAMDDCEVVAPIEGVVLERNVEVGDFVAAEGGRGAMANAQFALIADMTKLRVEVDVSELDIARLRSNMPCTIIPEAYRDRRYHGSVMWIDPGANYSKATVQVKVRIRNPDDYLRVEGSAQVAFLADAPTSSPAAEASAVWIPVSACQVDPSGSSARVLVVGEGRLQERRVSIGRRISSQVEIVSGLTVGEAIVADGLEKFADGQRVRS